MMTAYEKAAYCQTLINNVFHSTIEKALKNKFGINTEIKARSYQDYVTLIDNLQTDVDKKMRSNKLQRALFKSISIGGTAWYEEETNTIGMRFNLYYGHVDGGSNGHQIGTVLIVNTNTNTYKWNKF